MSRDHKLRQFPVQREGIQNGSDTKKPAIRVAKPYPLLDPGEYIALCSQASFEWAQRFSGWKARLVLEPQNYTGRPYTGELCRFLGLGKNPDAPYAGPRSDFRLLWVEVNGDQPVQPDVTDLGIFTRRLYQITVETVTKNGKGEPLLPVHWYSIVRKIRPLAPSAPFNPCNLENLKNPLTDQPSNLGNLPLGNQQFAQRRNEQTETTSTARIEIPKSIQERNAKERAANLASAKKRGLA